MRPKTIEELQDNDTLCEYCEIAEGANTHPDNMCEGRRCDESYDAYLDEFNDNQVAEKAEDCAPLEPTPTCNPYTRKHKKGWSK